ncbi:MAG: haloacid dehalogenase-like hydrolase, partial [Planctomycetota bacterium]
MREHRIVWSLLACLLLVACGHAGGARRPEPLPSWHDGEARQRIVDFVARVTDPASPDFVPEAERIAT